MAFFAFVDNYDAFETKAKYNPEICLRFSVRGDSGGGGCARLSCGDFHR